MRDIAEKIVGLIILDISDRSGLGNEWEECREFQDEIKADWVKITENYLKAYGHQLPANENKKTAQRVVNHIIEDMLDRGGLEDGWEQCDKEMQNEIKECWVEIVTNNWITE